MEEGLSKQEFEAELNKYPIVRDRDWQSEEVLQPIRKTESDSLSTRTNSVQNSTTNNNNVNVQSGSSSNNSNVERNMRRVDTSADFWEQFRLFLNTHRDESSAAEIFNNFKKNHDKYLQTLSLDDIEIIAAHLLREEQLQVK
eukprot:TRINITY_DN14950_c0_g1_i1.p1 TRINITY_DN14950_c0_g1~~TRINITY_DN14950_c0_g1_i1.p1  ORF type:complete len:142 (-),score=30.02 TRINITY_DN14950_c0_g1_i1:40-465(-)